MTEIRLPWLKFVLCLLLVFPAGILYVGAQITSSGYSTIVVGGYDVEYPDTVLKDNIYVFCNQNGSLSASLPGAGSQLGFDWSRYDSLTGEYGAPFRSDSGGSSTAENLESGGYRVRISDGEDIDTVFRAWVFVNSPLAGVDEEATVSRCEALDLFGTVEIDTFRYYDPVTGERYELPGEFTPVWTADPFVPVSNTPQTRVWNPPPVTTDYTFEISYYECRSSYTVTEEPVTTKAEFTVDPEEGEAPLEVTFDASASLNAAEYNWYMFYHPDTTDLDVPEYRTEAPVHTYYIPGEYQVGLRTVSEFFCEDLFILPDPVRVLPSELEVPNVFSVGPGASHEFFRVMAVSLREFRAIVYNRNGRKVFEWTDPEEGWDGQIDGTPASPGVYFYIITGEGWDDIEYEFTGPLYLFRTR